ncbi:MAG: hypothetical protein B7Y40_09715 [Gammaproteobacteria bacterium 28-57-27]|nr:MAG: hypothetical protein B7Y40_09715 [Gammaproteobacteria bacterium 28-57-27]
MLNLGLRLWLYAVTLLCLNGLNGVAWADETRSTGAQNTKVNVPLIVGVAPHTSVRELIADYQPLRHFLQKALQRDVSVVTAPNFDEYLRRALAGRYDLAITTGHQARLLQTDAGYLPLVTYQADFSGIAVVAASGKIKQAKDLSGQSVANLSPTSLVTLWSSHWLQEQGVVGERMHYISASDSIAELVLAGEVAAGFLSQSNYDRLGADVRARLHILAHSPLFVGRVYMLNPRLEDDRARFLAALEAFANAPEAQAYFTRTKLLGYRPLNPGELEMMEPYAQALRLLLAPSIVEKAGS